MAKRSIIRAVTLNLSVLLPLWLTAAAAGAEQPAIQRLEPPFWWQGFKQQELQLMVYGPSIAGLKPRVDYPGISVSRVERMENPNYLFVYLNIDPAAAAGSFRIEFQGADGSLSHDYQLRSKNPDPDHARGFSSKDVIYLITPDRFANGDSGNDAVAGMGDRPRRQLLGGRHGGDIKGIADHLDYFIEMGFTAIWLNPVLENKMPEYSYHGYSTTDYYKVDPRYGSNESYRQLVQTAKSRGIGVIMDMIVNHIGSKHWWMADLPGEGWINFQGEYRQTSHERTVWQDPYASEYDKRAFADGWFVPTMPDLNQRNPLMADYLIQNTLWWIEYLGLAGIRMDTYPYPDKDFMTQWTRRVMAEYPDFNIVGEEWSLNHATVAYWQRGKTNHDGYVSHLPSLMDFPLQSALVEGLTQTEQPHREGLIRLYRTLSNDFLYADPDALVIFPDNHDMSRIYTQLNEDYDLYRMAMVYMTTMRGTPQLYYGTEVLMTNPGSDDHGLIRSDFPGGWSGDRKNAFTGKGLSPQEQAAQTLLKKLLHWRRKKAVIHHGQLMQFKPHEGVYSYFRYDDSDQVMVIMNKNQQAVRVNPARYAERLGTAQYGRDVLSGQRVSLTGPFSLPPRSVMLLDIEG